MFSKMTDIENNQLLTDLSSDEAEALQGGHLIVKTPYVHWHSKKILGVTIKYPHVHWRVRTIPVPFHNHP